MMGSPTCRGDGRQRGYSLSQKRSPLCPHRRGRKCSALRPFAFFSKERGTLPPPADGGRESKGVFSFAKENTPIGTPRERPDRQPRSRRRAAPPEWKHLRGGLALLAAIGSAIRFDLLLLPAAALPILQKYSLTSVYRWCQSRRRAKQSRPRPPHHPSKGGERSNAADAQAVRRQTTVTRALRSARG